MTTIFLLAGAALVAAGIIQERRTMATLTEFIDSVNRNTAATEKLIAAYQAASDPNANNPALDAPKQQLDAETDKINQLLPPQ